MYVFVLLLCIPTRMYLIPLIISSNELEYIINTFPPRYMYFYCAIQLECMFDLFKVKCISMDGRLFFSKCQINYIHPHLISAGFTR